MAYPSPFDGIFTGGQMTDLPAFSGALPASALFEVVSPGDPSTAANYSMTAAQMAALIPGLITPTILEDEAAYASVATDIRILVKNTGALTSAITMLLATNYSQPVLIKDIGGFASAPNPISISFTGGESCDGETTVTIETAYGWVWLNPLAAGGFYAT